MEKVLSQDEVNALLTGLDGDDDQPEQIEDLGGDSDVVPFSLGANDSVSWGHLPSLQMICEKWARAMRDELSGMLLEEVAIDLEGFTYKPFQEFVDTLLMPSAFTICRLNPLQGNGILIMEADLVTNMTDLLFGGRNQTHVKIEGRDFTAVERHFIREVATTSLKLFKGAWEKVHPISFEMQRLEVNPQFAMVIGSTDMAVCCQFSVEIHHQENRMFMVFPYSALEPIKEKLASVFKGEELVADSSWVKGIHRRVMETEISVAVELGRTKIPLGEIAYWEVGDVVQLDNRVTDPLKMTVADVPKYWGYPGEKDGYLGFQVHGECKTIETDDDEEQNNG